MKKELLQEAYEGFCELLNAIQIVADYTYEISGDLLRMEKETDEGIKYSSQSIYDNAVIVRSFVDQIFSMADEGKPTH